MNLTIYEKDYSCRTKDHFWFQEIKQSILSIVEDGLTLSDIEKESRESNFFNAASSSRSKEVWQAVNRRLTDVPRNFMDFYVVQNVPDQKLLSLVLIMAEDRTFFEFMNNVIKEKFIVGDTTLKDSEVIGFFHDLQNKDEKASSWTDASIKKARSLYKGMLKDSGIAKVNSKELILMKPILSDGIRSFLQEQNLESIMTILAGER